MKRRKASKAVEKAARAICDTDEFVAHAAGVAALYRSEREMQDAGRRRELREALKALERHAAALAAWLKAAQPGGAGRPEQAAIALMGEQGTDVTLVQTWAARTAQSAGDAVEEMKSRTADSGLALRVAADALRGTFEHHRLKWSTTISKGEASAALALLCAIARDAGDRDLTPTEARQLLRQ